MTTYDHIASNKRRSVILILMFFMIVLLIGWLIDSVYGGGGLYVGFAGIYSTGMALISFYSGDKVALAASGARQVTETNHPYLVRMVENLCITTGTPMPKVYIIDDPAINAFATGRDPEHSSIAVTTGAIEKLENEELEGVLAHELSHIRNYDIRVMTLVVVLVGVLAILSDMFFRFGFRGDSRDKKGGGALLIIGILLLIFAPLIGKLIQLAVSRKREYLADASGALITRFPEGLARALKKIGEQSRPMRKSSTATAHLFIANPLSKKGLTRLFSTHPPVEERIKALENMAGRTAV